MPAYSKETTEYHKSRIRTVMVINPTASSREIQRALKENQDVPLNLTLNYIHKLLKKINGERARRNNQANINLRISQIQDKMRIIDERLWDIVARKGADPKDKIAALRSLTQNEIRMLQAEMDAGVYKRKIGEISTDPTTAQILKALRDGTPYHQTDAERKNTNDTASA